MTALKLRTHTCGQLKAADAGTKVTLMGWVARVRDFGQLVFVDLRDHYGITQIVITQEKKFRSDVSHLRPESVVQFKGTVQLRESENKNVATGAIEVLAEEFHLESASDVLPSSRPC